MEDVQLGSTADVVMIDSDSTLQNVINALLQDQHIRTEPCTLGWKAHACVRETRPKVVILEVELPDINGFQLFYLLRADPQTCAIPVIFLTDKPQKVREELPNYEAMNAVLLSKPFNREQLIAAVTTALGS